MQAVTCKYSGKIYHTPQAAKFVTDRECSFQEYQESLTSACLTVAREGECNISSGRSYVGQDHQRCLVVVNIDKSLAAALIREGGKWHWLSLAQINGILHSATHQEVARTSYKLPARPTLVMVASTDG